MQEWQQRVIDEQNELALKLGKLKDFIDTEKFKALSKDERDLLIDQRNTMRTYLLILSQRIALFKDASET